MAETVTQRLPLTKSDDRIYQDCKESGETNDKTPLLQAAIITLIGIVLSYYFMRKLYFRADDRGWLWFLALLLAGAIFMQGVSATFGYTNKRSQENGNFPCLTRNQQSTESRLEALSSCS